MSQLQSKTTVERGAPRSLKKIFILFLVDYKQSLFAKVHNLPPNGPMTGPKLHKHRRALDSTTDQDNEHTSPTRGILISWVIRSTTTARTTSSYSLQGCILSMHCIAPKPQSRVQRRYPSQWLKCPRKGGGLPFTFTSE